MHALELDFGPDAACAKRAVLVLNGWVDWADGSTFLKAAQSGHPLASPRYRACRAERPRPSPLI